MIDERHPAPNGTVLYFIPQGSTPKETFAIDFRSSDLNALALADGGVTKEHYLAGMTVDIGKGESIGFRARVIAPPFGDDISYHIEVTFDAGPALNVYDPDGKPFRIVSYPPDCATGLCNGLHR